jgi:hypothetical protein
MEGKKYYVIAEDTYHQHIDREVHLYGLLHQLAFTAGKAKDAEDMEHFRNTAIRYGEIADEVFEGMNIPGRYLVFGDKTDLAALREKELEPIDIEDTADDDGECTCLRCALEGYLEQLEGMADIIAEAIEELAALGGE